MAHAVESHPQRKYIIDSLLSGMPLRKLAATLDPPLHYTALGRYRGACVKPAARNAVALAKVLGNSNTLSPVEDAQSTAFAATLAATEALQAAPVVDRYLARTEKHRATIDAAILNAQADQDGRTIAALISTDLKGLELDARLTGRLDGPGATQNHYYIMAGSVSMRGPEAAAVEQAKVVDVEVASCDRTDV